VAPHTGQSSQLPLDANDGNAQFLRAVARSGLARRVKPLGFTKLRGSYTESPWLIYTATILCPRPN